MTSSFSSTVGVLPTPTHEIYSVFKAEAHRVQFPNISLLSYHKKERFTRIMFKVVGYRKVQYTNKASKEVRGTELYVIDDEAREGVTGYQTEKLWLSERVSYRPKVNENIRVYYNKYGSIDEVMPA